MARDHWDAIEEIAPGTKSALGKIFDEIEKCGSFTFHANELRPSTVDELIECIECNDERPLKLATDIDERVARLRALRRLL